uniref:Uncharacterized protein n=1 Tax=Oryza sativa subsp. indica TaxID=39946 RepID=I4DI87_ORYSI|nr:hypothetical protein [Oryza sativa Indica Group]
MKGLVVSCADAAGQDKNKQDFTKEALSGGVGK